MSDEVFQPSLEEVNELLAGAGWQRGAASVPGSASAKPSASPPRFISAESLKPSGLTPYQEWELNTKRWDHELREERK